MAYDTTYFLTGTAANPVETLTNTSGTILTNNTRAGVLVAPNRVYIAELRIGNAPTGTSPQLITPSIRAHSTAAGTGADIVAFTTMTESTTTLAPESASGVTRMAARTRAFRVEEGSPYLHLAFGLSTTAVFPGVSVVLIPLDNVNN